MAVCCGKCFTDSNGTSFQDSIVREMGTKAGFGGDTVALKKVIVKALLREAYRQRKAACGNAAVKLT